MMRISNMTYFILFLLFSFMIPSYQWSSTTTTSGKPLLRSIDAVTKRKSVSSKSLLNLLSDKYFENDIIAVQWKDIVVDTDNDDDDDDDMNVVTSPRICVVKPDKSVYPLCRHEDDLETDLFIDPRCSSSSTWMENVMDQHVIATYGEGWYGQRVVPSLGGGPGYGAEADEIWSIDESTLEQILDIDNIYLPTLDLGIAHGEKARGGAI